MTEAEDHAKWLELIERLANGDETARDPLRALDARRAAERDAEQAEFAEQMGGTDPEPGIAVERGYTAEIPPVHVDTDTGWISGGSLDHNRPPWLPPRD